MSENKSKISVIDILKGIGFSLLGLSGVAGLYLLFIHYASKLNPDFVGTTEFTIMSICMFIVISLTFFFFYFVNSNRGNENGFKAPLQERVYDFFMKNLRAVTSILFPLIILTIVVLFIFIAWKNILPQDDASKGFGVWWTALSIMCTLIVALIAFNYFKVKDIEEIKAKNKELEEKIEKSSKLATLPSRLIDVYDGEYFRESDLSSSKKVREIREYYKSGFYSTDTIRKLSTIAWKENNLILTHKLRKLALELEPEDCWNKTNYINILTYMKEPVYKEWRSMTHTIKMNENEEAYSKYCGFFGRYLISCKEYDLGLDWVKKAIDLTSNPMYCRIYAIGTLSCEKITLLRDLLGEWERDKLSFTDGSNNRLRLKYTLFNKFINSFCNLYSGGTHEFYSEINPKTISLITNTSDYYKVSFFNLLSNIRTYENTSNKEELIQLYLTFYYFLGADDDLADKELEENPELVNQIYANIMQHWPINQQNSINSSDIT